MTELRAKKVATVQNMIPKQTLLGDGTGDILLISWGGTFGHTSSAVEQLRAKGKKVSLCHISYINPLPVNLAELFKGFKKLIVAELNMGQMANYLRMELPEFEYLQYNKVMGQPFTVHELVEHIEAKLK